ncbi:hypothetical protein SAY86_005943 [Trapa natans]|uniref:Uncharacterized protein n=1 Tax=Trapa natans TaxID=22666 RepID=A0AAN7L2G2_TRANT|nr:hypothetical protein SAY86_005943 [Trapa natans]
MYTGAYTSHTLLEPYSPCINEHLFQGSIHMEGYHIPGRSHIPPSDEDGWHRRVAAEPPQGPLHLPAAQVLVKLMDSRTRPELIEERLYAVAHEARALGEDHRCLLRCKIPHSVGHFSLD